LLYFHQVCSRKTLCSFINFILILEGFENTNAVNTSVSQQVLVWQQCCLLHKNIWTQVKIFTFKHHLSKTTFRTIEILFEFFVLWLAGFIHA
jgi:hypothetical protein